MKNIWLHSTIVVVLGSVLIAVIEIALFPAAYRLSAWMLNPADAIALIGPPLSAFAKLAPALLLGWFTRRHPLVVGAIAGACATLLADQYFHSTFNSPLLIGKLIASAMIVAVAALAGRALRYRFTPTAAQLHLKGSE